MATATLRKLPDMSPFEQARERWQRATAARRELAEQLEGAQMALALRENPPGDRERRSPSSSRRPRLYLAGRRVDPDRLRQRSAACRTRSPMPRTSTGREPRRGAGARGRAAAGWPSCAGRSMRQPSSRSPRPSRRCRLPSSSSVLCVPGSPMSAQLHALPDAGFEFGTLADYHSLLSHVEPAHARGWAAVMPPLYDDTGPPLQVCGYAVVFNVDYSIGDGRLERVKAGAFDLSVPIFATFLHDDGPKYASTWDRTLQVWQDDYGLAFAFKLAEHLERHRPCALNQRRHLPICFGQLHRHAPSRNGSSRVASSRW